MTAGARRGGIVTYLLAALLTALTLVSAAFGVLMLVWARLLTQYEEEPWGLLGVWTIGGPGLLIQAVVLSPYVLLLIIFSRRRLARWFRASLGVLLCVGIFANALAQTYFVRECVFYDPARRVEEAAKRQEFYTTGLRDAVEAGDADAVKAILASKPELVFSIDAQGDTALVLAVKNGHRAIAEMLLACGAPPDEGDRTRRTPLSWAAELGDAETARLLLDHGAAVNRGDYGARTPLAYAERGRRAGMAALLEARGGATEDLARLAFDATISGRVDLLKALVARGLDVKSPDCPFLHEAVAAGKREVVAFLISQGADVNANSDAGTPLHDAAWRGDADIIRLLVASGADVNARSLGQGRTPLDFARYLHHEEAAAVLRQLGASQ
jgi:ankyrin repeat protein